MNRLDLVVGPNGAGKSTFVELTLAPLLPASAVVNADQIAKHRWPTDPAAHAYEAAEVAAATRAELIELRRTFIAETVFSHPSKLELIDTAHAADYTVALQCCSAPKSWPCSGSNTELTPADTIYPSLVYRGTLTDPEAHIKVRWPVCAPPHGCGHRWTALREAARSARPARVTLAPGGGVR
jgi:hypothetical protein